MLGNPIEHFRPNDAHVAKMFKQVPVRTRTAKYSVLEMPGNVVHASSKCDLAIFVRIGDRPKSIIVQAVAPPADAIPGNGIPKVVSLEMPNPVRHLVEGEASVAAKAKKLAWQKSLKCIYTVYQLMERGGRDSRRIASLSNL